MLAPRRSPLTPNSAFTLIEMVVVVAIIGLLLAIAVPVSVALVRSNQSKLTTITMETVKNAIDTFQNRKPLRNKYVNFETSGGEGGDNWILFGPLPPSPTAQLSYRSFPPGPSANLMPSNPSDPRPLPVMGMEATTKKFTGTTNTHGIIPLYTGYIYAYVWLRPNGTRGDITAADAFWTDAPSQKYLTIECLIYFLRNYSPEAKTIIDKLGKSLTNEDSDLVVTATGVKVDDLFEVRDAWKNVIQYNFVSIQVPGGRLLNWELRSAGPDGKFVDLNGDGISDPFAAVEAGDDVIVSGTFKLENQ